MNDFEPLTDAELDELDTFLFSQLEADRQTMLLGAVHGFFTAEQCGPLPMPFADAIDLALGEAEFESARQQKRMRALLGRLWLEVEAQLDAGEEFEALLHETVDDEGQPVTLYADWCLGFLDAVENSEAWQERLADDPATDASVASAGLVAAALSPIVTLGYRGLWEGQQMAVELGETLDAQDAIDLPAVFRDEVAALTPEQITILLEGISPAVRTLDTLNADWRSDGDVPLQTPVRVDRIGRNDPCPCGSGRKYKKCCGAPANDA